MKYCIIFFLFVLPSEASSQNITIDSLKQELQKIKADTTQLRLSFSISHDYMRMGMYDSQLVYAEKALALVDKISVLTQEQKKYYAGSLRLKGIYFRSKSDYENANAFYMKALTEFEAIQDTNGIAAIHTSIGIVYLALKRYEEAYTSFTQAYRFDSLINNTKREIIDLANMSTALQGEGNSPEEDLYKALTLSYKAMELSKTTQDKHLMLSSVEAVALSLFFLSRYDESLVYQKEALSLAEAIGSKPSIAEQQYLLAQLYYYKEDYVKALEYGILAEQIVKDESISSYNRQVYGILADIYEKTGNWEKAYSYSKKLNAVIDSTYRTEIAEQLKIFETERKDNEIFKLNSENELLKAHNETSVALLQRNRGFLIAAIVSVALISTLLFVVYRNRQIKIRHIYELKKLNAVLQKQKEEISRINTILELKALRAQMNPHFIFNCMSSIQECILTGRLDDADVYLTKLSKLLRMVLEYSDNENISLDKELEMLELYLKLESVRLKNNFEYQIQVEEKIYTEEVQIPALILQPFAENAIWHGLQNKPGNRKLKIDIRSFNHSLQCIIEDNGIGRKQAEQLKPLQKMYASRGIKLIEKRLDILKQKTQHANTGIVFSDLNNNNTHETGTRVEIILPFLSVL